MSTCKHGVDVGLDLNCGHCDYEDRIKADARAATIAECVALLRSPTVIIQAAEAHENLDPMFGRVNGGHWVEPSDTDRDRISAAFEVAIAALAKKPGGAT